MRYIFLCVKIAVAALAVLASSSHAQEQAPVIAETGRCKIVEVKKQHWNRIIMIDGRPAAPSAITGMYLRDIERARAVPGGGSNRTYIYSMVPNSMDSTLLLTAEAAQIAFEGLLNRSACN